MADLRNTTLFLFVCAFPGSFLSLISSAANHLLQEKTKEEESAVKEELAEIVLSLRAVIVEAKKKKAEKVSLEVFVKGAYNLSPRSKNGFLDPYAKWWVNSFNYERQMFLPVCFHCCF